MYHHQRGGNNGQGRDQAQGGWHGYDRCHRAYRDLAPDGAAETAARGLFDALRWTEGTGARFVVVQDVSHDAGDLAAGVADRIFRAASGKVVQRLALLPAP